MKKVIAYASDYRQDPWFGIIISICSDAQVDLLVKRVFLVRGHKAEERVFGCMGYDVRTEGAGADRSHVC